ncbi:MAG TPA: ATP-binding protein [Casimicrobiaceae bacterium]|nr:ATP-binding protein [Casimicrobiaceae bacterium]
MSGPALPVLVFAPTRDSELTQQVLAARGQACLRIETDDQLLARIGDDAGALLIAEELLSDRLAERLVSALARQPPWSDLPILLVAHAIHERRHLPGLDILGNVAVLTRPMAIDALASAVSSALRARRRQFQLRDLLNAEKDQARRKDQFLAMLAHELRNPLAPVRFAAQVLETTDLSADQSRETAALIGRQVSHMARIIDDLLDVSRLTRGLVTLDRETLDLAALARRIALDHQPTASTRGVVIRTQAPEAVLVHGDRTRLKQVLDNLLDNAIKFSPAGADVEVVVEGGGGEARLEVRDQGEGLHPELVSHLFEPFSQADRSLDRNRGGLGLGLALVRALTRLHGGEAIAASDGPGRGSTFTITLPLLRDDADPRPARVSQPERPPVPVRVLIAEDNHDAADSLRMLLELAGHEVHIARTGPEAIAEARRLRPDIVLCDIGLPGMSGYDVARTLRGDEALAALRLVAVTGYATEDDRLDATAAGFDRHLRKPVEPDVLMAELATLARRRLHTAQSSLR